MSSNVKWRFFATERRTFLRNHADGVAAMDLFVVPSLLYGLLIMRHGVDGECCG